MRPTAHFPDPFVRLDPDALEMGENRLLQGPPGLARRDAVAPGLMQGVHHLAEHVELQLAMGGIADAHRRGAFVARQPGHLPFRQPPLAGDAVHDLHLVRAAGDRPQQPFAPRLRLVVVAGIHQREQVSVASRSQQKR